MKKYTNTILSILLSASMILGVAALPASATVLPIAGNTYNLSGAGVAPSATSITLQSFTIKQTGQKITDGNMSDTFYLTLDPGNNSRQEIASCTTVTQNGNNTATLSGCTRGLSPITPFTASTTLQFPHAGGSQVVFSDAPQFFNQYTVKENDEAVTGAWTFPTPVAASSPATKSYVDSFGLSGSLTVDRVIVPGTAGETLAAGNILYQKTSDGRWYKAGSAIAETTDYTIYGIAQGAGTAGASITTGVLLRGQDSNQSGLTAGVNYFVSATPGALSAATSSVGVGKARSTTALYLDPSFYIPKFNTPNTYTGVNTFNTASTTFNATTTISATSTAFIGSFPAYNIGKNVRVFTSAGTTTFAVPSGITKVWVRTVGGGGGGGGSNSSTIISASGGSAAYVEEFVDVTGTSTIQVFIGSGGAGGASSPAAGANGTWSTFGTNGFYHSAGGGLGGNSGTGAGGDGGTPAGGDVNITGFSGQGGLGATGFTGSAPANTPSVLGTKGQGGHGNFGSNSGTSGSDGIVIVTW